MKNSEIDEDDEQQGIKKSSIVPSKIRVASLFYVLFLLRRLVMILIVVFVQDSVFRFKVTLLLFLQTISLVYASLVRSFANKKDQVVETFNEAVILVLMVLLASFNSQEEWNDIRVYTFIGIILLQSYILLLTSMICAIVSIIRFIQKCQTKTMVVSFEEDENKVKNIEDDKKPQRPSLMRGEDFSRENLVCSWRNNKTLNPGMRANYNDLEDDLKKFTPIEAWSLCK